MMSDRLSEIEGRLDAAALWPWDAVHRSPVTHEVVGPTPDDTGGVLIATDVSGEDAELIAHAPADLAALVKFAREVEALHTPFETQIDGRDTTSCRHCLELDNVPGETPWDYTWPCPTAAAIQRLGSTP